MRCTWAETYPLNGNELTFHSDRMAAEIHAMVNMHAPWFKVWDSGDRLVMEFRESLRS